MYTVFITGPLASGKRCACLYLAQKGFTHIDLDAMAKGFLDDEAVQKQLVAAYGTAICDSSGAIDKARLAQCAFAKKGSSDTLNGIIWPLVKKRLSKILAKGHSQPNQNNSKFVVEVAMLAEAPDMLDLANAVIGITADKNTRIERALARGMVRDDILNRIALQATDEKRAQVCDLVIDNSGSLEQLYKELDAWFASLE